MAPNQLGNLNLELLFLLHSRHFMTANTPTRPTHATPARMLKRVAAGMLETFAAAALRLWRLKVPCFEEAKILFMENFIVICCGDISL